MGLKDLIKGQLLSSISYRSEDRKELARLFDREDRRIMYGSVLTVMPGQTAVFINEGRLADVFEPGRFELITENMPVMTALQEWKYGFNESFIVDVVFVNTNDILDMPWGTSEQLTIKDETFGMVNLGAHGNYTIAITDAARFVDTLMGTKERYMTDDLKSLLTSQIAMLFKEVITENKMDFFDIQSYCYEASEILKNKATDLLADYGISVNKMSVQVALPEVVKKAIDERATMGAMGGMNAYAFKKQVDAQAEAMVSMAKNESTGGMNSMAGMGMQMSAGMAMGGAMGQAFGQPQQAPTQSSHTVACEKCGSQIPQGSKFCPQCGTSTAKETKKCIKCGKEIEKNMKFCPECGASQQEPVCPKCGAKTAAGARFCPECGQPLA